MDWLGLNYASDRQDLVTKYSQEIYSITYVNGDIAYVSAKDLSLDQIDSLTEIQRNA